MLRDVRLGIRGLVRHAAFAWTVVFTLGLGIGATAAVFSLIQGVLLTPPPYDRPDDLVLITAEADDGTARPRPEWAAAQWREWVQDTPSLVAAAAYRWTFNFAISEEGSESLEGLWVSQDYFSVTGLEPILGRPFGPDDHEPGAPPVVLLGHDLWQRAFGGDPDVVGRTLRLSRRETPPTIIGVMPAQVRFLPSPGVAQEPNYDVNALVEYWIPVVRNPEGQTRRIWNVVARLGPGATPDTAQTELTVVTARQARSEPEFDGLVPHVEPLTAALNANGRRVLLPLLGAAVLVLVIACGNTAALFLVRGVQRRQEYGLRGALGAGRAALFRQVATESLVLAGAGATVGVALALGLIEVFRGIGGHAIPRLDAVTAGWPLLLWSVGTGAAAALGAAVTPAWRAGGTTPAAALSGAGSRTSAGRTERRLLSTVIVMQTALTLALLAGAGLLLRTMYNLSQVSSGYDTARILTMSVTALDGNWMDFHVRALERVSATPGVELASFAWGVPLTGNSWPRPVEIEGQPLPARGREHPTLPIRSVTPGYFELLGQTIVNGRDFAAADREGESAVAIVNQAFVERYFSETTPLGKRLWPFGRERPPTDVVGVVSNARTADLAVSAEPEIYLSLWQAGAFSKHLVVRSQDSPRAVQTAVERELRAIEPTVAVENVRTLDDIRAASLGVRRFVMQLLVGFSLVATLLTLGGIYGVLALGVASRRREIAVRSALGAGRSAVRSLVFGESVRLLALGVAVGLAGALAVARVLESFLFEVTATDPVTLMVTIAVLAGVSAMASWVPAQRAARVEPLEALREG